MEWHHIGDANDPELDRLAERYALHPLHVEDCRHRNQSAKIEENEGYLFVVLKPAELAADSSLDVTDLDLFLGRDFLITVQEAKQPEVSKLLEAIRASAAGLRADQVFYKVMDAVVDSYGPILDRFSEVIDILEDEVLERPSPQALAKIFATKRAMIELRRVLVNMRDVSGHLQRTEHALIPGKMWPFLRDVYDHLARNLDLLEVQRDLLTGSLDIYLSSVANRTNRIMKVLTLVGTVTLPVLLVSSFYGMNIRGLPWAESPHAVVSVFALIGAFTVLLVILFRVFKWF